MSDRRAITTANAPAAIGPYSQAIAVGDMLFTSGQIPIDPATGELVAGGITEQTTQLLRNLNAVLSEAGMTAADVVKTTVFLQTLDDFAAMNAVYAKTFAAEGSTPPARSTIEVNALPKASLVEIECVAQRRG